MTKTALITLFLISFIRPIQAQNGLSDIIDEKELQNFWRADSLFNLGEYATAASYYNTCEPAHMFDVAWPIKKGLCYLLNGDTLKAQSYIRKYVHNGGHYQQTSYIEQIPLLNILIPEEETLIQFAENTTWFESSDVHCKYPEVLATLTKMRKLDQDYRAGNGSDDKDLTTIDSLNQLKLDSLISIYGWLGYEEVGISGENASFLVIQHADLNPEFQKKCLPLLRTELFKKNISPQSFAMLYDRVQVNNGKSQVFGTQVEFDPTSISFIPKRLHSRQLVNAYRLYMGLGTLKEYLDLMNSKNN